MKKIILSCLLLLAYSCKNNEVKDPFYQSTINDKVIISAIQEIYEKFSGKKNDSTDFINIHIDIKNDSLLYYISHRCSIDIFIINGPPCFIFKLGNIPITVTSDDLNQFGLPYSTLMEFYHSNSKFSKEYKYFLTHKIIPPPYIDDNAYPTLVYYKGKFIRKVY